jgi:hypothetical protein
MTVRRLAAAAALILAAAVPAGAQTFGYGGKAGVNLVNVSFESEDLATSGKIGIVAGGFVTLSPGGPFSLEVDAYYSERKFTFTEGDIEDRLAYVELPILARFRIMTRESWHLSAVGGAALSFLQSGRETISGAPDDITSKVESMETSAIVGAQAQIGRRIVVDVRYLYGVSNVFVAADFPAKTRGFQITGGYRLK